MRRDLNGIDQELAGFEGALGASGWGSGWGGLSAQSPDTSGHHSQLALRHSSSVHASIAPPAASWSVPEPEPEPEPEPVHSGTGEGAEPAMPGASAAAQAMDDHRTGYVDEDRWTAGYIQRQKEHRSERAMRPEKLEARLAITAKRHEEYLYLSGQRLSAETAEHLAAELARSAPRVHELYLSSALYDLGKPGWYPIVRLGRVHRLTKLYLGQNDIGTAGVKELVSAFRGSSTLQLLELAENSIGGEGAVELAQLLSDGTSCCMSLTGLGLRDNVIGNVEALKLLGACLELPSLQWLDLGGNPITDKRVWATRGSMLDKHRWLASLLPVTQRLAWAQATSQRLGRSERTPSPAYQFLSADLIEMVGVAPLPGKRAWNGKIFQRWDIVGGMAAATNRHVRERRRDPSGGLLTRSEFAEIYDDHSDGLWRQATAESGAAFSAACCGAANATNSTTRAQETLRWTESTIESAHKKELLVAIQAVATEEWLREKRLHGRMRSLLKKTSAEHLRTSYLALKQTVSSGQRQHLVELENEFKRDPVPASELEAEPEPEPDPAHTSSAWLTREQVQALAQIGDVRVALHGTAIPGGGTVQGQLRRSQGRRNGKVLTHTGEIVWFSFADIESGDLLVLRS